jgi:dolichol-phosphate mannosyltransferase
LPKPLPTRQESANQPVAVNSRRALIGVCTLNEAENIRPMLLGLRSAIPNADVLVIDDDSSDGTAQWVMNLADADPAVKLIVRRDERGLGSAIRLAMMHAERNDYEFFLNLDADLSHDPAELPGLLERAKTAPQVDVVIGSRYVPGGAIDGWPLRRRMMSRIVNGFATLCLRLPVSDCSGSMRCYRVDALRGIGLETLRSDGYSILEEVLVRLHRSGSEMAEVPITFTDRVQGESKLTLREAIRSASRIFAMAFR